MFSFLKSRPRPPATRRIRYRGELLSFHVPADWQEEAGADGGAAYFPPSASNGWTLHVEVLSMQPPAPLRDACDALAGRGRGTPVLLPSGLALSRTQGRFEQGGRQGINETWHLAQWLPPDRVRIAVFALTVPVDQAGSPAFRADLQTLCDSLPEARFSPLAGSP
jgi:hypothetical protein